MNSTSNGLKFIKQPDNTTIVEGRRLLLKCKPNLTIPLKSYTQNASMVVYKWFRDGKPIALNLRTVSQSHSFSLLMTGVKSGALLTLFSNESTFTMPIKYIFSKPACRYSTKMVRSRSPK